MELHLFCPGMPAYIGTFRNSQTDFDSIVAQLVNGFWIDPDGNTKKFAGAGRATGDPVRVHCHHTWSGIQQMFNNHGNLGIPRDTTSKRYTSHKPLAVGDIGLVIAGIGKQDFSSSTLNPRDFEYVMVERLPT